MHREGDHLQFGIGAAHAVAVDQRQAGHGGDDEGRGGVDATRLAAKHGVDLFAEQFLEGAEGVDQLVALRQLFGHHGGGAHHADRHDQRVVGHLVDVDDLDRAIGLDGLLRHELADIGIAAAAGAEDGATGGDVFHVFGVDGAQDFHGLFLRRRWSAVRN